MRLGHKTALSQAKPMPFTKHITQIDRDYLQTEVTNQSFLPLKLCDAKLLHVFEWKKEKEKLLQLRSKQIMDKLEKRMKASSENRHMNMIEEV